MVERTGEAAESSNFRILQDYFRDKFFRYFEGINHAKWLIMEESLYSVIFYLLNPIPEQLNVLGSSILCSNKVSIQIPEIILECRNYSVHKSTMYKYT